MDYLCYTVEESKFVRGNQDAQRMIIETMKRKLCGRSDEKDQPRRSTLGELILDVLGSFNAICRIFAVRWRSGFFKGM